MADTTPRLDLPLLQPGQAQKELFHNEALALIDLAAAPVVEALGLDVPPADPLPGQCWIVGSGPSGEWAGQAHALAGWTANGWRFLAARAGMSVWCVADGMHARFDGTRWVTGEVRAASFVLNGTPVLATQSPPIPDPSGGSVTDDVARATLAAVLAALRHHRLIAT